MVINKDTSGTPASLRKTHRGMILSLIHAQPGISRVELARTCGFSEMAATRIVRELMAAGIIESSNDATKDTDKKKHVGRPKTGLHIVNNGLYAAGITVSAYHSEVSICDAGGKLYASRRLEYASFDSATEAARFYANALRDLIKTTEIDADRIVGVGVALSAITSSERSEIVVSEYFGWSNDGGQFCREIEQILNLPVEIENISNALAIAEMRFGVARNIEEFTLIHAAIFVGAGVVSGNRLVRGDAGVSGMLGHFRSEKRPLTCICGRDDCLNLSATGFGLLSQMGKLSHRAFDISKLSFYAASLLSALDDPKNSELVAEAGEKLAPALDSVSKLLGPKMIILGGHLGADDCYFNAVKSAMIKEYDYDPSSSFQLVKSTISSVESAALLALHAFCYSSELDYDRFARLPEQSDVATYE